MDNQRALQPIRLRKAKPQHGRAKGLEAPVWIEQEYRSRKYARRLAEIHRRERRAAAMEKVKVFVAGIAFVVFSLATAVVR